jgi:hypothetical protein
MNKQEVIYQDIYMSMSLIHLIYINIKINATMKDDIVVLVKWF